MALDKVIDSAELDAGMTATANAIREKTGSTDPIAWDAQNGFKTAVEGIQAGGGSGGDSTVEDGFVTMTIESYENNRVTGIGANAFCHNNTIKNVRFPNVVDIGGSAFDGCANLETIYFPMLETFSGYYPFRGCDGLTEVEFAKVKATAYGQLQECEGLISASFPEATVCAKQLFYKCTKLKTAYLPKVTSFADSVFQGCTSLEIVDLPSLRSIARNAFNGATLLKKLVLRSESMCTLANVSAFTSTLFASGGTGGVLLAPSALVESYKTATNWSVLYGYGTNRFLALEDYTVDGTITGEIDWDKVNALFEEA